MGHDNCPYLITLNVKVWMTMIFVNLWWKIIKYERTPKKFLYRKDGYEMQWDDILYYDMDSIARDMKYEANSMGINWYNLPRNSNGKTKNVNGKTQWGRTVAPTNRPQLMCWLRLIKGIQHQLMYWWRLKINGIEKLNGNAMLNYTDQDQ